MRTLIRRRRDPFEAGVLRGEKAAWDGEIEQAESPPAGTSGSAAPPDNRSRNRRAWRWRRQGSCQTLAGRLMSQVDKTDTHWMWTGRPSSEGYGTISVGNRTRYAHRVMYEQFYGPIPSGLEIDHLCRTPLCVNPEHLEAVTRSVNLKRGYHYNAVKTHCPQGHRYDQDNTQWARRSDGRSFRMCRACHRIRWLSHKSAQPEPCRFCGGRGYYIGGDEYHVCWCQQPDPDVAP